MHTTASLSAVPHDVDAPEEALRRQIGSARVVVFASGLTDLRAVIARLEQCRLDYKIIRMGMATAEMRERFHQLQEINNWRRLPQIFIDGRFIGGYDEFFGHPLLSPGLPTERGAASDRIPVPALVLGAAGLIPFVAGVFGLWFAPPASRADILSLFLVYAAVILSFIGAVHWGAALHALRHQDAASWKRLAISVAPALVAWGSFFYSPWTALTLMLAAFVGMYWVDRAAASRGEFPPWYARLRAGLTAGVGGCLLAALIWTIR